jgi:hypothetical protein
VGTVHTITSADTPEAALAAIQDPQVAAQLRVQLAEIAAEREKAERQAERDELLARLAGVASARSQTVAQAGSRIACPQPGRHSPQKSSSAVTLSNRHRA